MKKPKVFLLKPWIIATLRKASYRFPGRYLAQNASKIGRNQYVCATCKEVFGRKNVQLDHKVPIIDPEVGFVDWNTFIERLFVPEDQWQTLCKPCHKIKSDRENLIRKEIRAKKKLDSKP